MEIRKYRSEYCGEMAKLFYDTVHTVNSSDYSEEQLDVWATGKVNIEEWDRSFSQHYTLVAVEKNAVVGFGDIDEKGYLDRLYVHKDYQRQGIASALCDKLESANDVEKITVHASITARPFFESRGYKVIREQQVLREDIPLTNFVMEKPV